MADITRGTTYSVTETITNAKLHSLVDDATIANIVNADLASGAAISYSKLNLSGAVLYTDLAGSIPDSKLNQITTASKVSGIAITALASLPAGAGVVPSANLPAQTIEVVQVVNTITGSVATGTTILPIDDTIPQNTEGDQYMTLAVTPTNSSNYLKIDVVIVLSHGSATGLAVALFQDTTANALASALHYATAGNLVTIKFTHYMVAGTTSATTFKVRAGSAGSGTTTFNGVSGGRLMGGVLSSSITISEITA